MFILTSKGLSTLGISVKARPHYEEFFKALITQPMFLIELKDHLAKPLAFIFNETLQRGKIPLDWKRANVSPIFKKGSRNLPENYRAIGLTSIICKMMETLIRDRLVQHLQEEILLSPKQHGLISGRSMVTQLLNYMDKSRTRYAVMWSMPST